MTARALISKFEADHLGRGAVGSQQRKSAGMRARILETTMDCIATSGYGRTTTELVCREAGIARGAMLHHYPNRRELIKAVIEYAFYKRMKAFVADVQNMSDRERVRLNLGIQRSWQRLAMREYQVYLQLHVASRTDPELRRIFLPRARHYDKVWRENIAPLYPEWNGARQFDLGSEFTRAVLEGLRLNADIWANPRNEAVLIRFVTELLILLREGKLRFPSGPKRARGNTKPRRS